MSDLILSKDAQLNLWDFSVKLSKSDMVPAIFKQKPDNVFATILYGKELGLSPIVSLNSISVIQGQVSLKVQTMNGVVLSNHPQAIIQITQDEVAKKVIVSAQRNKDDVAYIATWDMEKAKQMGLAGKDNYIRQPLTMLRARALSEALRMKFADTLLGFLSTEEMEDLPPIRETMSQTLRREVEMESPTPPEEKVVGPLYRFSNGKFIGKQLKDLSKDEVEEYYNYLVDKKNTLPWQKDLCFILSEYLTNFDSYKEMLLEISENEN